jgi:hypothetical protein
MPTVPDVEPTTFTAGDTVKWTRTVADYPASDGWALSYSFRHETGDGRLDVNAVSVSSETFIATISITDSGRMNAGAWQWAAYASKPGERYQVATGNVQITPNLFSTNFNYDLRSTKKKAYDNAREAMETFAKAKMCILNGRTYTARDYEDLKKYVNDVTTAWIQEQQEANNTAGGDPRKIYAAFNRDF